MIWEVCDKRIFRKVTGFVQNPSVTAQRIIDKGWCFHLDACAATCLWSHQIPWFFLWCWALVLDSISKEAQLCLSSGSDENVHLQRPFSVFWQHVSILLRFDREKTSQKNLVCLDIFSDRFKMKTRVVLFVCTARKIIFRNISRWFAALNLPLLDWKKVCII